MKFTIVAAVCLSLVVCALANDLHLGDRQDGDVLAGSARLTRSADGGHPMIDMKLFDFRGKVTAVNAVNFEGSHATLDILYGGIGYSSTLVTAVSVPGEGLDVQVDVYAILDSHNDDGQISL